MSQVLAFFCGPKSSGPLYLRCVSTHRFLAGQACSTKLKFLDVFARLRSSIEVEELSADGDDMRSFPTDALRRYGCAILFVALAAATRLALHPILGNRYPFFLFFIAVVLAAGYGGYGPSLLALVLSWLSVNYLFPKYDANPSLFESKSQIAFGFFLVGLAVTVLGGFWRSARERARSIVFRDITERHRAEQAKKESDDRFHQLADHISDVFWIHELDASKIGYVSPAYESLWGRSCQSLYKQPLSYLDAVHDEDRERATQAFERLERGKATATEYRIVPPMGQFDGSGTGAFRSKTSAGELFGSPGLPRTLLSGSASSKHSGRVRSGFAHWPTPLQF